MPFWTTQCSDQNSSVTPILDVTLLDSTGIYIRPRVSIFDATTLDSSAVRNKKRVLAHPQTACPPRYRFLDSSCNPHVSPQAFTILCDEPYGQRFETYLRECEPTQICVSINTDTPHTFAAKHQAFCVDYEYFVSLAKVYVEDGSTKAGTMVSQINLSPEQRASLAIGKMGVAAVITGPDNHTSIFATDLKIEADGVSKEYSWAPPT